MNFIKHNLLMIIVALVVVAALVLLEYPLAGWNTRLRQAMTSSLNMVGVAGSLGHEPINIPGQPRFTGPITPEIIKRKNQVQKLMAEQAREIKASAVELNSRGRVQFSDGFQGQVIPLLAGTSEPRLLPHLSQNVVRLGNFKRDYRRLFQSAVRNPRGWLARLRAGLPPSRAAIQRMLRSRLKQVHFGGGGGVGGNKAARRQAQLKQQWARQAIYAAAARCRIYAAPSCFQERNFVTSVQVVPSSLDIYDAFVDTWLQNDVVNAIILANHGSLNVGESPVKRLLYIRIGSNVQPAAGGYAVSRHRTTMVARGGLFLAAGAAPAATPSGFQNGYPSPSVAVAPGGLNYAVGGLTGHVGSGDYEVTHVAVGLVIEPGKINDFINNLYRENNGYTLLNMQIHTVDPIDAATHGYIYGRVPTVQVDLLFEEIMFNQWNGRVMPAAYRGRFGIVVPQSGVNGPGR